MKRYILVAISFFLSGCVTINYQKPNEKINSCYIQPASSQPPSSNLLGGERIIGLESGEQWIPLTDGLTNGILFQQNHSTLGE